MLEDRRLLAAAVGQLAWLDLNADGFQDAGEPGVAGAVVELFDTIDGVVDNGDDRSLGTRITDTSGGYQFPGLAAGDYYLQFRPPVGLTFTTANAGGDDALDSDAAAATGQTALFSLAANQADLSRDVGLVGMTPEFGFAATAGAAGTDQGRAIASDADGNVLVTGRLVDSVDFDPGPGQSVLTSVGGADIFVAKYSSAGALVWARSMGGAEDGDEGLAVAVSSTGDVYVAGRFRGAADFDQVPGQTRLISQGEDDIFVARLSAQGDLLWARGIGGVGSDRAEAIALDSLGDVYATGAFQATVDFDPGAGVVSRTSAGADDIFVLKLDGSGGFHWAAAAGGSGADHGVALAVDLAGGVFAGGDFSLAADFDPGPGQADLASAGGSDAFVWKLDATGAFVWARRMGGVEDDGLAGLATDSEGAAIAAGAFGSTADFGLGGNRILLSSMGSQDVFVAKHSGDGALVWARSFGGAGGDEASGVAAGAAGGLVVTGLFEGVVDFDTGPGVVALDSSNSGSSFVLRLDGGGETAYVTGLGGGAQRSRGLAWGPSKEILVTGDFDGLADFDPGPGLFPLASAGGVDAFLVQLKPGVAPTVVLPPPSTVGEDALLALDGLVVAAADPTADITVTLTVAAGSLTVRTDVAGGLSLGDIWGGGTRSVRLVGSQSEINATLAAGGGLTYRSDQDFNGSDTVVITVADGGPGGEGPYEIARENLTLIVTPVNDAPQADDLHLTAIEDVEREILLTGDDGDPDADQPLTFVLDSLADASILSETPGGPAITADQLPLPLASNRLYIRAADYSDEFPRTFEYHVVEDAGGAASASEKALVSVDVTQVNDPPTAPDLTVEVTEDGIVFFALTADDGDDADDQQLSYFLTSLPAEGTLEQASGGPILTPDQLTLELDDGVLLYTAPPDFYGEQTFQYYVRDDGGVAHGGADTSEIGTVTLRVGPVNDPPELTGPTSLTTRESERLRVGGLAVTDSDAELQDIHVELSVSHGAIIVQTGGDRALPDTGVFGNGSSHVLLTGALSEINATLGQPGGVVYDSQPGFQGVDTMVVTADDLGNTGRGPIGRDALSVEITVIDDFPWRNSANPMDVNDDGFVSPLDALLLINRLNSDQSGPLPLPPAGAMGPPPYLDPSGDNALTAVDVLQVINQLNAALMAEGETRGVASSGESSAETAPLVAASHAVDSAPTPPAADLPLQQVAVAAASAPIAPPPGPPAAAEWTSRPFLPMAMSPTLDPVVARDLSPSSELEEDTDEGVEDDGLGVDEPQDFEDAVAQIAEEIAAEGESFDHSQTMPPDELLDEEFPIDGLAPRGGVVASSWRN